MTYKEKRTELRNQAFTQEFRNNEILVDVILNTTNQGISWESYENGDLQEILIGSYSKLPRIIQNKEAYRELLELDGYNTSSGLSLLPILDYMEDHFGETLVHDNGEFSYKYIE